MIRFTMAICTWWLGLTGIAAAQPLAAATIPDDGKATLVKTVAAPPKNNAEILPPVAPAAPVKNDLEILPATQPAPYPKSNVESLPPGLPPASPGEAQMTREVLAHQQYLLQSQAQAESVHRAAVARFEQRTRRLESQRWFGISNSRPLASTDPYDGDYSPGWVSNNPFYPFRWIGSGPGWGWVECQ